MNILLLGAAGFIGTNLTLKLAENNRDKITLVDKSRQYFSGIDYKRFDSDISIKEASLDLNTDFDALLYGQDVVYHLVSTTVPATSNQQIGQELMANVVVTANILDACVRCGVKKVVFISSGGTVYGKEVICPLHEDTPTYPISSYGIQKVTIEKLLYLYHYLHGLDYRVIRLANPYGPYQRPNGVLGAVTTFTFKALKQEEIIIYGDGSIVRDFLYIDDAVRGILAIVNGTCEHRTFNLGSGYGTSIKTLIDTISVVLNKKIKIAYKPERKVDVPINYLDISRYEKAYGKLMPIPLSEGIRRTAEFMKEQYHI